MPLLIYFSLQPLFCVGQSATPCVPLLCSDTKFKIEIVPIYSNVSTDCIPAVSACGDRFHQMFYTVRLRYSTNDPALSQGFYLDYSELHITIGLHIYSPTSGGLSAIDLDATKACSELIKTAQGWSTSVVEKVLESSQGGTQVSIDFMNQYHNQEPCLGADPIKLIPVVLDPSCPSGFSTCLVCNLFTVVVNAYSSETINLECIVSDHKTIYNGSLGAECTPACAGPGPVTVASLSAPAATDFNNNIQLQLQAPLPNASGIDGCGISLVLTNNNTNPTDLAYIDYAEFVVKVSRNLSLPEEITSVATSYYTTLQIGNDTYYHFIFPLGGIPYYIPPNGGSRTIAVFNIKPSIPNNLKWSTSVSLVYQAQTRLLTNGGCSTIPYSPTLSTQTCSYAGIDQCSKPTPVPYEFHVKPGDGSTIKIGLTSSSLGSITLDELAFELDFDMDPSLSINYLDEGNFCTPDVLNFSNCFNFFSNNGNNVCYHITSSHSIEFCMGTYSYANPPSINFDAGEAYMSLYLTGGGCVKGVTVKRLIVTRDGFEQCVPPITLDINKDNPDCLVALWGTIATQLGAGVDGVSVEMDQSGCPSNSSCGNPPPASMTYTTPSGGTGIFDFNVCTACNTFIVTPSKDDNPLNGVSTYDLVLISKHILGIQPLTSPYYMIAADANHNGTITTFDIVDFRKLILGLYTKLPANTSWRFVDKDYAFPNPSNPFSTAFPENWHTSSIGNNGAKAKFVAIKIGDVNGSAIANNTLTNRPSTTVSLSPLHNSKSQSVITIPVTYTGAIPLEAIQLGLRFNPSKFALIGPSQGDVPNWNAGNFGLTKTSSGEIRTLWIPDFSDPFHRIQPGDILFYLSFRKLTNSEDASNPVSLDGNILDNLTWNASDQEMTLQEETSSAERSVEHTVDSTPLQASFDGFWTFRQSVADQGGRLHFRRPNL
jgi:hypothetical protein